MKFRKVLLSVCSAAAMIMSLAGSASAAPAWEKTFAIDVINGTEESWNMIGMANDDTVSTGANIRNDIGGGDVVGCLYRGGAVKILDRGEDWVEVLSGNVVGYVDSEYLIIGNDVKGLAEYYGIEGVAASWDDVHVFAAPDANAEIIYSARAGETFRLLEDQGHWLMIEFVIETEEAGEIEAESEAEEAETEGETEISSADNTIKAYVSIEDVAKVLLVDQAVPAEGYVAPETEEAEEPEEEYEEEEEYDDYSDRSSSNHDYYEEPSNNNGSSGNNSGNNSSGNTTPQTPATEAPSTEAPSTEAPSTEAPSTEAPSTEAPSSDDYVDDSGSDYVEDFTDDSYSDDIIDDGGNSTAADDTSEEVEVIEDDVEEYNEDGSSDSAEEYYEESAQEEYVDNSSAAPAETYAEDFADDYVGDYTEEYTGDYTEETASYSEDDLDLMAGIIYCEAGNQSYDGMVAVGAVVMNRVNNDSFPDSVSDVIYQEGQFTPASSGDLSSAMSNGIPSECYEAAAAALNGENPVGSALYFNTGSGSGVQIGDHQFY